MVVIKSNSTLTSRLKSSLRFNFVSRFWLRMRQVPKKSESTTIEINFVNKYNYRTLGLCATMGWFVFWLQMKQTKIRSETFKRNFSLIEQKYGEMHRNELGQGTHISKYGYPDMGNNIYSDLLPYKDWIKINNAQRCHENLIGHLPVFFTSVFISSLTFPKFTFYCSALYMGMRFFYTYAYLSFRGYNRATASEEIMKLILVALLCSATLSSMRIMGLHKLPLIQKITPKRFKK